MSRRTMLVGCALLATGLSLGFGTMLARTAGAADATGITLVREAHRWELDLDEVRLRIKLFVRNDGTEPVEGKVVVRVVLQNDGLEQSYLEDTVLQLGPKLEEMLRAGGAVHPRSRAILNYLERGKTLPEGKTYEPCTPIDEPKTIRIKIPVRLRPGEMKKEVREDFVPDDQGGYRIKAEVESLEVGA